MKYPSFIINLMFYLFWISLFFSTGTHVFPFEVGHFAARELPTYEKKQAERFSDNGFFSRIDFVRREDFFLGRSHVFPAHRHANDNQENIQRTEELQLQIRIEQEQKKQEQRRIIEKQRKRVCVLLHVGSVPVEIVDQVRGVGNEHDQIIFIIDKIKNSPDMKRYFCVPSGILKR
ncbi:hypothetical protein HN446_00170, partial [bacterium]|nr:hypothetical protein [bacterium]